MRFILEYDDFCDQDPENCINFLENMFISMPDLKINMFTIPANRGIPISNKSWCNRVRDLIHDDKLQLAVHGLFHTQEEFQCSDEEASKRLAIAESIFDSVDLPFLKVFRGPHWGASYELHSVLSERGYTHWYNHEDHISKEIRNSDCIPVYYNYNLADDVSAIDINNGLIVAHGHTHDVCHNGIEQTWDKIKLIDEKHSPEWGFVNQI